MNRRVALFVVLALSLGACTQDPPPGPVPSESPTATETASETPEPQDTEDEPSEEPTATPSPDPSASPSETATEEPSPEPSESTNEALGSWAQEPVTVAGGGPFVSGEAVTRGVSTGGGCSVSTGTNEVLHACTTVRVKTGNRSLSVVDATDEAGTRTVRVYQRIGTGSHVSRLSAPGGTTSLATSNWPNGDGLILATLSGGTRVVVGTGPDQAAIVADLGVGVAGEEVTFTAGRIVRRIDGEDGGSIQVLAPGPSSSAGSTMPLDPTDPPPVDIALRVYRAWITGDFSAMSGLATPEVIVALQRDRTTSDLFTLRGTSCTLAANEATCTFDSSAGATTWTLARRGGNVQVVHLG